jgi:hypothetical protein
MPTLVTLVGHSQAKPDDPLWTNGAARVLMIQNPDRSIEAVCRIRLRDFPPIGTVDPSDLSISFLITRLKTASWDWHSTTVAASAPQR